jgi:hypothetical protein
MKALFHKKDASKKKSSSFSQPKLCKKWKNPLQEMDEFAHKMEDSTMIVPKQNNPSLM